MSQDKGAHLTTADDYESIFQFAKDNQTYDGMTEEQLRAYKMWTLEQFQDYLIRTEKINDKDWLNNYLRPKFKQALVHIARMAEQFLFKHSGVFEIYGVDFMLDETLHLWFIECNESPDLMATTSQKNDLMKKLLSDLIEIQYGYLRSRMKRILKFLKEFEDELSGNAKSVADSTLSSKFKKINKNKLEKEYTINSDNQFILILDQNLPGKKAYFGHLNDSCFA